MCVVGVVVAINDINTKYTTLTLDDGSGANIEIKIVRLDPEFYNPILSPSNTELPNVNVISRIGVFDVTIDNHNLDIGTVIKAKCTIDEFRDEKQLLLKRVWIVSSTDEEVQAWTQAAAFKRDVLSTPWHISSTEHRRIKKEEKLERRKVEESERLRAEYVLKKHDRHVAREEHNKKREAKLEARRRKEEVMMNAGALI